MFKSIITLLCIIGSFTNAELVSFTEDIKKNFNEGKLISITKTARVVKGEKDEETDFNV